MKKTLCPAILIIACCTVEIGCTSPQTRSETTVADEPHASLPNCASEFARAQFIGAWSEEDSASVTTLTDDGALVIRTGIDAETGTWEFTRWGQTPSPPRPGDENDCVLWLRPSPVLSLVYGVQGVTEQRITLTYIGRGNTIVWNRANRA